MKDRERIVLLTAEVANLRLVLSAVDAQLTTQSASLTQALERAERAERQSLAWEMLATATALTTGKARFFRQKDQSAAEWNSTLVIADTYGECAVNLATKLGLLDSASQVKP